MKRGEKLTLHTVIGTKEHVTVEEVIGKLMFAEKEVGSGQSVSATYTPDVLTKIERGWV